MEEKIILKCPHCEDYFIIYKKELNCHIIRHGIYKTNYKQIEPHLCKKECDRLIKENLIYGCGKPCEIIKENNEYKCIICEYK
jgi:hypothetical protein